MNMTDTIRLFVSRQKGVLDLIPIVQGAGNVTLGFRAISYAEGL